MPKQVNSIIKIIVLTKNESQLYDLLIERATSLSWRETDSRRSASNLEASGSRKYPADLKRLRGIR